MSALPVTADTCGSCGAVHGRTDPMWSCPTHGHLLQAVPSSSDGQFERYTCPAFRCPYERSAPVKPRTPSKGDPMTTIATRPSQAVDLMWDRSKHIGAILPGHIDVKSFIGTAAAALYGDAKLMAAAEASPESLIAALMECASLGHRPGTEEYYLTPRKKGGKPTVLGIEGYRGIVERMYRSGAVSSVIIREVCAKDRFRFVEGADDKPQHFFGSQRDGRPSTGADFFGDNGKVDRGPMVGVYAYAILTTGAVSRVVLLSRDDVMKAKESSEGSDSEYSPWNKHERAMWWKTAARRLEPWVPTSAEYRREQLRAAAEAARRPEAAPEASWSAEAVPPPAPEPPAAIERPRRQARGAQNGSAEALWTAIGKQFGKLGLEDEEERAVYVHKLANSVLGAELTEDDLRFVLSSLADCGNIAELQELVAPVDAP